MSAPNCRRGRRTRPVALIAALALCAGGLVAAAPVAADAAPRLPASGAVDPLPGQSAQPAPPSQQKRAIENVHTDTVSAFVDDGRFVLDSKADVDGEIGKRFAAGSTLFHLSDTGKTAVPGGSQFRFLGVAGDTIWLAPQIRNPTLIWPGFSTEHPSVRSAAEGELLSTRMIGSEGPGAVEVYMTGDDGPDRIFSSTTDLPDWQIGVPQHTHMNWVFTQPGSYTLTFEMSGRVGGKMQRAQQSYTFVVGDLAAHTRATTTNLSTDVAEAEPGAPVVLTAQVAPEAVGAVQFRDTTTDVVLGHSSVGDDGAAAFRTGALQPGERRIVAEFVPSWSDDFTPSVSEAVSVMIRGEQIPKPENDDTRPVTDAQLREMQAGVGVRVTSAQKTVAAGGTVSVRIDEGDARGDWVSVWVHSGPVWLGWVQTDLEGRFSVSLPDEVAVGKHRLVVKDREGEMLGWDDLSVTATRGGGGNGGGSGGGSTPKPRPAAKTAKQDCRPAVTLDHGHIDAFAVSAGGGKAVMQLLEDVTGHRVLREAETVLLRVKERAHTRIPAGVPGGSDGYLLPLSQDPALIWPGWDTNRTRASGYTDVSINITGVNGPGRVSLYTSAGSFGGWQPILTHGGYYLPGIIREREPAHTHAQWVFSQQGVYTLTAHAVARNPRTGKTLTTATHTYVFQVGDVPLGDVFCSLSPHGAADAALVNAAVQKAGEEAIAADQADAADKTDENEEPDELAANRSDRSGNLLEALLSGEASSTVVAALVAGGALVLAGIAGGTFWAIRRIGMREAALISSAMGTDGLSG